MYFAPLFQKDIIEERLSLKHNFSVHLSPSEGDNRTNYETNVKIWLNDIIAEQIAVLEIIFEDQRIPINFDNCAKICNNQKCKNIEPSKESNVSNWRINVKIWLNDMIIEEITMLEIISKYHRIYLWTWIFVQKRCITSDWKKK